MERRVAMYFIALLLMLFIVFSNNYITISTHQLPLKLQKECTHPLSIVHISDLHNKNFGIRQSYLIRKIESLHPDLIAITGDLVDGAPFRHAAAFIQKASRICPIYYVRGNHESIAGNFPELEKEMLSCHINILKDTSANFRKDGILYQLTGLDDPAFQGYEKNYLSFMGNTLRQMMCQADGPEADYKILLSHRPELFHLYSSYPFDLVLCGHAHGGQFRPPFTDGLYAPNQGVFPKYASGAHVENHTTEIISRGLGNSVFPLRLFNFPEIIKIVIG